MYTQYKEGAVLVISDTENAGIIALFDDGKVWEDGGSRVVWKYRILDSYGTEVYSNDDLRTPVFGPPDPKSAMSALLSFLTACAESASEESENYSLFPPSTREWAEYWSDELVMAQVELDLTCICDRPHESTTCPVHPTCQGAH